MILFNLKNSFNKDKITSNESVLAIRQTANEAK